MSRWAIVNTDGIIVNVVEWDGPAREWLPPRNHHVIEINDAPYGIGDSYDFATKKFDMSHRLSKPDSQ